MIARDRQARRLHLVVRPPLSDVPKWRSPAFANIRASLGDATQKLGVMFKTIVEPVVLRRKADQDAGRSAVASDDDFFTDGQPEVLRQVILDFGEGHRPRSWSRLASP